MSVEHLQAPVPEIVVLPAPTKETVEAAHQHFRANLVGKNEQVIAAAVHQFLLSRTESRYIKADQHSVQLNVDGQWHDIYPVPEAQQNSLISLVAGFFDNNNAEPSIDDHQEVIDTVKKRAYTMELEGRRTADILEFVVNTLQTQCPGAQIILEDNCVFFGKNSPETLIYAGFLDDLSQYVE